MSPAVRGVAILGSTGSIGCQALDVIASHPDRLRVVGLVAGTDGDALAAQAAATGVTRTGLGEDAAIDLASSSEADVVLNAIVGAAGLRASVAALEAGKTLALANKESLVAGGDVCAAAASRGRGRIVPVDSEHAALAQCLKGRDPAEIRRLIVTASGGPFRKRMDLSSVTPDEALAHPTWAMGPKITVDSATLMNKGLEAIEAHHLFGVAYDDIEILVQPQSIVHGIVEMRDGSQLMSAATPDMRLPIQAALLEDESTASAFALLDLAAVGRLDFEPLDHDRFPAVRLAYEAGRRGGTFPAVLNAANEIAVRAFLDGKISFLAIVEVVEDVLSAHSGSDATELEPILEADRWSRAEAERYVDRRALTPAGGNP